MTRVDQFGRNALPDFKYLTQCESFSAAYCSQRKAQSKGDRSNEHQVQVQIRPISAAEEFVHPNGYVNAAAYLSSSITSPTGSVAPGFRPTPNSAITSLSPVEAASSSLNLSAPFRSGALMSTTRPSTKVSRSRSTGSPLTNALSTTTTPLVESS